MGKSFRSISKSKFEPESIDLKKTLRQLLSAVIVLGRPFGDIHFSLGSFPREPFVPGTFDECTQRLAMRVLLRAGFGQDDGRGDSTAERRATMRKTPSSRGELEVSEDVSRVKAEGLEPSTQGLKVEDHAK